MIFFIIIYQCVISIQKKFYFLRFLFFKLLDFKALLNNISYAMIDAPQ